MYNYELSIVVPGIRNEHWVNLYEQTKKACKKYTFEMIFVGPVALPNELQKVINIKYIKDFGTPTRAYHLGTLVAEGRFINNLTDDSWVYEDSIDKAIDLLLTLDPEKDVIIMRYCEGENHSGQEPPDDYWTMWYHGDGRLPFIDKHWRWSTFPLMSLEYYKYLGGFDCRFEHLNMNTHDFAFRAQRNGSKYINSPTLIQNMDWDHTRTAENSIIIAAYKYNDLPLFTEMYTHDGRPIRIEENWKKSPVAWPRRNYDGNINLGN